MNKQITHKEVIEKVNKYMYGDATIYTSDLLHLILDYASQQEQKDKVLNAEIGGNVDYFWQWTEVVNKLSKVSKLLALYKQFYSLATDGATIQEYDLLEEEIRTLEKENLDIGHELTVNSLTQNNKELLEENRKVTKLLDLYKKLFGFCHFRVFYNPNGKPIYFTIHIKQKRPQNQQALKALLEIKEIKNDE